MPIYFRHNKQRKPKVKIKSVADIKAVYGNENICGCYKSVYTSLVTRKTYRSCIHGVEEYEITNSH